MSLFRFFSSKSPPSGEDETSSIDDGDCTDELDHEQQQDNPESIQQDNPLLPEELCELPTFLNTAICDKKLVEATRSILNKKFKKRPESFTKQDYDRMSNDDWTVSRFLLRCRLDPKRSARLMEQSAKFRKEFKMGQSKLSDFPIEFHKLGGLFHYAPDRVGNETLYMRVKMHRRVPELSRIIKEYIMCVLELCDLANNGRGTAIIFDLTDCGLQNIDPSFLYWLVSSFRNYCPKGLSYILVYNLPWIMNATSRLALSWMSSTNRRRMRFISGEDIKNFISEENLPDYMGGKCKMSYRDVPIGSISIEEHHLTKEHSKKLKEMFAKILKEIDANQENNEGGIDGELPASIMSSSIVAS